MTAAYEPTSPTIVAPQVLLGNQRWLGLSEQFFRIDKWIPCRGDENDGPAERDRLNSFFTWAANRPESFQILSYSSGLCLLLHAVGMWATLLRCLSFA
jgi:hypothetical protein